MDICDEGFEPISNELDRSAEHDREPDGSHLVGVGVNLDAERATDVLADYTYLVVFKAKMFSVDPLHHVGRLAREMYGELFL